ncbi:probable protein COFACTOR ASSEMBLY OF COMPLEX C SUBUNIT B CCB2, chloroplastic [Coccomyxa sp. Obi]|nr:probable protein COFACTOR ASSEMBLY OF COMPLEX C SUBUNIT B CCB2, chloroplastic [Coccomyxa sp. Obi]
MFLNHTSITSAECQCAVTRASLAPGNLLVRSPVKPRFVFVLDREGPRRRKLALSRSWRGAGFEETDIAVFRFTLGIPGFDDALIPRVVGLIGAALLVTNHLLDQSDATSAQIRTEFLGSVLSATCILTPSIGKRLQEAQRGRGRLAKDLQTPLDSTEIFQIADDASDRCRTELAWASYALLRNTNSRGMIVVAGKKLWLARGAVNSEALQGNEPTSLEGSSKVSVPRHPSILIHLDSTVHLPPREFGASSGGKQQQHNVRAPRIPRDGDAVASGVGDRPSGYSCMFLSRTAHDRKSSQ